MIYITRRLEFCASHRLFNPEFSDEQNQSVFGNCNNPNGHGHNYVIEVTIKGAVNPQTGMLQNWKHLKDLINTVIVDQVDHKNLNLDVPFLKGLIPTAENMAVKFWEILGPQLKDASLHEVRIYESQHNFVSFKGHSGERSH